MSDDEFWDDDGMEDDGDDDGSQDDQFVAIENQYFTSKDLVEDDLDAAIDGFKQVLSMEKELDNADDYDGEWGFKSLKRLCKLLIAAGETQQMLEYYRELLAFGGRVTNETLFKGMNKVLDQISASARTEHIMTVYTLSLDAMAKKKNHSAWFKTKLKLAKLLFEKREYDRLAPTIDELRASCQLADGSDDPKRGSNMLDVLAVEIQLSMQAKNKRRTQELHRKALAIAKSNPGILNSRLAIFHFCGGKIHMEARDWQRASEAFYESFRFFEESGDPLRIPCLRYILLANMLMVSPFDPFDSPDMKNLRAHAAIAPMAELLKAYQSNEMDAFATVLRTHERAIMDDSFIAYFMADLLREMRTQVVLTLVKPYSTIYVPYIAKQLNITDDDVMSLLVSLILDQQIVGRIDQVRSVLVLQPTELANRRKYKAIAQWSNSLAVLQGDISNKLH